MAELEVQIKDPRLEAQIDDLRIKSLEIDK